MATDWEVEEIQIRDRMLLNPVSWSHNLRPGTRIRFGMEANSNELIKCNTKNGDAIATSRG